MPTVHNRANVGDIAKTVIMPGDPLRAKYIAENFLDNYKLVSDIRNVLAYTGKYKGKDITIMASGMGMPSMGVYCYELYKFYNVENIVRIGSCGGWNTDLKLFDIILCDQSFTESNFALSMNNEDCHLVSSSPDLDNIILSTASELDVKLVKGATVCADCFDWYMTDFDSFKNRVPKELNALGAEMEAFALFYTAKVLGKKAACFMSVVDLKYNADLKATTEERETGLNNMITLALESGIKM